MSLEFSLTHGAIINIDNLSELEIIKNISEVEMWENDLKEFEREYEKKYI